MLSDLIPGEPSTVDVLEQETPKYTAVLKDDTGTALPAASLTTLTLTVYVIASDGTLTYIRNAEDALNAHNVTVDSAGNVVWSMQIGDTTLNENLPFERHVALWQWTWGSGKQGKHEFVFTVKRVLATTLATALTQTGGDLEPTDPDLGDGGGSSGGGDIPPTSPDAPPPITTAPLLQKADLTYVGAFKLPAGNRGPNHDTFEYANGYCAGNVYNDGVNGKSLILTGYFASLQVSPLPSVAQVIIPALADPNSVGLNGLNTATVVQGFDDPSHGIGTTALKSINGYGGMIVYNGKLLGTQAVAYDANCEQALSAWVGSLTFADTPAHGPYYLSPALPPRQIAGGYMCLVPTEWQGALGGKVLAGNGPASIVGCASAGPSLTVIDADTLAGAPAANSTINATPLMYFPQGHRQLGEWNSNSPSQVINGTAVPTLTVTDPKTALQYTIPYYSNVDRIHGILFPENTSSVLFFGYRGQGAYQYGNPQVTPAIVDPVFTGQGEHAYPYTLFCWAFNANDFADVKAGLKQAWEVRPYAGWAFTVFGDTLGISGVGCSWDPATRKAYLTVSGLGPSVTPVVHVFAIP